MTVEQLINDLKLFPEHYQVLIHGEEIRGVFAPLHFDIDEINEAPCVVIDCVRT